MQVIFRFLSVSANFSLCLSEGSVHAAGHFLHMELSYKLGFHPNVSFHQILRKLAKENANECMLQSTTLNGNIRRVIEISSRWCQFSSWVPLNHCRRRRRKKMSQSNPKWWKENTMDIWHLWLLHVFIWAILMVALCINLRNINGCFMYSFEEY